MTTWTYSQYVAGFIDILGQRDKLLTLDYYPKSPEEKTRLSQTLYETAGAVDRLRNDLIRHHKVSLKTTGILDKLPPEQRAEAEIIRGSTEKPLFRFQSDSIIWEIPVDNSDKHCRTTREIWRAFWSICMAFINTLAEGNPIRGGVELGFGVPIDGGKEMYGSASVMAYQYETKIANYPRIVIGNEVWQYLTLIESTNPDDNLAKAAIQYAKNAKSLVTVDNDNVRMLDIIGEGAKSLLGDSPIVGNFSKVVNLTYESLVKLQKNSINDIKNRKRYDLLKAYFDSRLHLWQS